MDVPDLVVTNLDNDVAGITVRPPAMAQDDRKGGEHHLHGRAAIEAHRGVAIRLTSTRTSEGTVSPAVLNFSTTDWNAPQIVTVTGVNDNIADGNQPYSIVTEPSTSTDPNYNDI
jgi:hypothetical protein